VLTLADSHMHLFRNGYAGRYGRSPAGGGDEVDVYEAFRHEHNIAAALVVGYEDEGIDPSNNAYLRSLAETRNWMVTVAFVAAGRPPEPGHVEQLLAAGHRGISLYLADAATAAAVVGWEARAWASLAERRSTVSLNVAPQATPAVATLAARYEGCSFAVSHLGDPGSFRSAPDKAAAAERIGPLLGLATRDNVYVKISGLYAISDPPHDYPHAQATPFVQLVLDAFGPDRCMWGSDFSPCLDHVSFEQVTSPPQLAELTETERARVMGGTLLDLLGRLDR
jgi:L-fuconolactonase